MTEKTVSRRRFLKSAALGMALGLPLKPGKVLGKPPGLSDTLTLGFIGMGKQGTDLLISFLGHAGAHVAAVCDIDRTKKERAVEIVNRYYKENPASGSVGTCKAYHDYRELLSRKDIDAVVIATPDHWHAIMVIEAAKEGKDIYCEKPLSLTVREARLMVRAVDRYERILQTGSMQRSSSLFRQACELVRNGYIGEVKEASINIHSDSYPLSSVDCELAGEPVPDYLDWEMWLGPAPWRPYNAKLSPPITEDVFPHWRDYKDYSGGMMTDWGAHHFDIVQWALGTDRSGPVEIQPPDGEAVELTYRYASGVKLRLDKKLGNGVLFTGSEGSIFVSRSTIVTRPENLAGIHLAPDQIHLYESNDHIEDWLTCIRKRQNPICPAEVGCRSVTVCHIGNIAFWTGQTLKWDPVNEKFIGNEAANRLLCQPMRSPWHV